MMFEIKKALFRDSYFNEACRKIRDIFPDFSVDQVDILRGPFYARWNLEPTKPYVLIANIIENQMLTRKEWYEYYAGKWNFVGYLPRERCIDLRRIDVWNKNKHAFSSYEEFREYAKSRGWWSTDEAAARSICDYFLTDYQNLKLMK